MIYLVHHGVKGMKWGVRKKRASNAGTAVRKSADATSEYIKNNKSTLGKYKRRNDKKSRTLRIIDSNKDKSTRILMRKNKAKLSKIFSDRKALNNFLDDFTDSDLKLFLKDSDFVDYLIWEFNDLLR